MASVFYAVFLFGENDERLEGGVKIRRGQNLCENPYHQKINLTLKQE